MICCLIDYSESDQGSLGLVPGVMKAADQAVVIAGQRGLLWTGVYFLLEVGDYS